MGGKNQDDGNLNFNKGAAVSRALKGWLEVAYRRDNLGAVGQLKAWRDFALTDGEALKPAHGHGVKPSR